MCKYELISINFIINNNISGVQNNLT